MGKPKGLIIVVILCITGFILYNQFGSKPKSPRDAITAGIDNLRKTENVSPREEVVLRIQLSVMDYQTRNGTPPNSLHQLVPEYFDSIPVDPDTKDEIAYRRVENHYELDIPGEDVSQVASNTEGSTEDGGEEEEVSLLDGIDLGEEFINPNTMKQVAFIYDISGKRDPFRPFSLEDQYEDIPDGGPLTKYQLGQLKVTAILAKQDGSYTAIVEDAAGKGYTVRPGTKVGRGGGEVISIEEDRIKILERRRDFTGKITETPKELKLSVGGG